jgi:hypothetical protein
MWFLEHESLFGGKRMWLRPGSKYLFGRTSAKEGKTDDGQSFLIQHKAVSRQHMTLRVLEVAAGDGTNFHARSEVEITDLSCRQGTTIDGERKLLSKKEEGRIVDEDKASLTGVTHTIRLAANYPEFR